MLMNPVYESDYVESVQPKHLPPKALHQKLGFHAVKLVRTMFDRATGYGDNMDEARWLQRMCFLETVAGGCTRQAWWLGGAGALACARATGRCGASGGPGFDGRRRHSAPPGAACLARPPQLCPSVAGWPTHASPEAHGGAGLTTKLVPQAAPPQPHPTPAQACPAWWPACCGT
jgi:hypothetical protein